MRNIFITAGTLAAMLFAYNLSNAAENASETSVQYYVVGGRADTKLAALKAALNEKPVWKCQQQVLSDKGTLKNAKVK